MRNTRVSSVPGKKSGLRFLWAFVEYPEHGEKNIPGNDDQSISDCIDQGMAKQASVTVTNSAGHAPSLGAWWRKRFDLLKHLVNLIRHHEADRELLIGFSESTAVAQTPQLLIIVTGCCKNIATGTGPVLVTDVDNSFEVHEFAAIRQRIQDAYQSAIASLARQHECMDETVIMNLTIDSFGQVEAAVLQPGIDEHPIYHRELESTARQWKFPAILRHGACSVIVSGHQFGQRAIDENGLK